jgi:hypothetical protein
MTPEDIETLKRLKALKDNGVLTEEEFEVQKQSVLNSGANELAPGLLSDSVNDRSIPKVSSIQSQPDPNSGSGGSGFGGLGTAEVGKRRAIVGGTLGMVALIAIVMAVSGGDNDSKSANPIDEKMNVSVRCVVTDIDRNEIVDVQEVSEFETLWTIAGQSYFYFNRFVTVTNYDDESHSAYIEHRYVDDNGKVFDSSNFLEYVSGGETQTFEENRIVQAPTEIVLRGNSATGEMTFGCPVTKANLRSI